jgi:hypothetical protein
MGIRDSFRRARETVADVAEDVAEIDRGRAARRAAVDCAKTTTDKAANAATSKTVAKGQNK